MLTFISVSILLFNMSHGKRYGVKERKEILEYLQSHTYQETMEKFDVSQMSLARWVKNQKRREEPYATIPLLNVSLLNADSVKEIQIYLKLLENLENVRAVSLITAAGELILPETKENTDNSAVESVKSGFRSIFSNEFDIIPIITNFLLCTHGFTQAVTVKVPKQISHLFDNLSVKTPIGTFLLKDTGMAILVVLFKPSIDLDEIIVKDYQLIKQIAGQISLMDIKRGN